MSDQAGRDEAAEIRDILLLAGGAALVVAGAGLLLAHPLIRLTVGANLPAVLPKLPEQVKTGVAGILPDVERYLRLRSM